jgi:NAD(P)-dependent dehydrogenase (short-subunit alcohol dehydrogenase family)
MAAQSRDPDFTGRVVWVTGAGQGMGRSHAERFAAAGAHVGCIDVDGEAATTIAEEIVAAGGQAAAVRADVSDWDSLSAAADLLGETLGPVEIAVANAGVLGPEAYVADVDPADWDRVIAVNLTGVFLTAKAAIPQLRRRGGSIVIVSSISGLRGYAGAVAYNASKHGVLGIMRTLANELAADSIRVNAVCPGWVDTPMFDAQVVSAGLSRDEAVRRWSPDQLMERLITPAEVSSAVLWLASEQASAFTGVALPVDGGMLERTLRPG